MQKRTLALILIFGGLAALAVTLAWLFYPSLAHKAPVQRANQDDIPEDPSLIAASSTLPALGVPLTKKPKVLTSAEQQEYLAEEAAKQRAMALVARQGSFSNQDQFRSIQQIYPDATSDLQAFLESQRQSLIKQHPPTGPSWGQTTRALAAAIVSPLPIQDKPEIDVRVETQQTTSNGANPAVVSYEEFDIHLQSVAGVWQLARITHKPWQP